MQTYMKNYYLVYKLMFSVRKVQFFWSPRKLYQFIHPISYFLIGILIITCNVLTIQNGEIERERERGGGRERES